MNDLHTPYINHTILAEWEKAYLPSFDLFFFSSLEFAQACMGNHCLIMSREDFIKHSEYNQIQAVNSYEYWRIAKSASFVCIAPPHLFPSLKLDMQTTILKEQKKFNRGLIFELDKFADHIKDVKLDPSDVEEIKHILLPYKFKYEKTEYIAFQTKMWKQLPYKLKLCFLYHHALEYRNEDEELAVEGLYLNILNKKYQHIAKYFNTYSSKSGPNCFASTLAALNPNKEYSEWMLTNWVYPSGFLNGLALNDYKPVQCDIQEVLPGDVIVWKDDHQSLQHATFHLQDGYFFNKDGQSFFNPWEIVRLEHLLLNWGKRGIQIYRRDTLA